jgi:predicted porin
MNKKLLAIAVAAFVAAPAIATAQTTLFGQFKYEVGYIDSLNNNMPGGADPLDDSAFVHSTKGTRLGVRGSEDLGSGTQAIYRFQSGMGNVNRGVSASGFDLNEENWVGLRGGFGTLQLGRSDTAMKKTGGNHFRAFTDTLAEPSLIPGRTTRADGIHYTTPKIAGFNGYLTVEPNGNETDLYYAVGADYQLGAFYLAAAFESSPDDYTYAVGMPGDESNWQVGGKWNFGQGDVGLLYQEVNDGDRSVFLVPVNFKITPNVNLRAAVKYSDDDILDEDWTNWGVGAQYMFSARTEAFVNVWGDDRAGETLTAGNNGLGSVSNDSTQFGIGMRHSF